MTKVELYQSKLMTPEQIAAHVRSNSTICSDTALAMPHAIVKAIGDRARAGGVAGLSHHITLELGEAPCYDQDLAGKYAGVSWFSGGKARTAVNGGWGDVMPAYYRDFSRLFDEYINVDYLILTVSPMNGDGVFACGCSGGAIEVLKKKAKHIYLEVNPNMPFCSAATPFRLEEIDGLCENDQSLPTLPASTLDNVSIAIGNHIAERISDGNTVQLGIGAIPDAVGMALRGKRHLGLHTEMFTDSMVELIQCGAVDNSRKPIHTGKTVAAFAYGSRRMYDYIDHNPDFEMLPAGYVNSPSVIAQHPNFVSINAALEVDFFGQVCSESVGTRHISATGGQVDFVRGAVLSEGGQSFIAFPSTAKGGEVSRIKPILTPGAIVTTSKNDVDCIVTEYGVAKLRGKTLKQRVQALIAIAHPKFRDELMFAAKQQNILL